MKQIALLLLLTAPTFAAENADQILRGMSAKLAASKHLTFEAKRELDSALTPGHVLPEKARITVNVSRPNGIAARSVSRERTMRFIADGRKLTVFNESKNHYAQVPMRTSIDGLVDKLDEEYGFVPPLADFAVSNPYRELHQQVRAVTYAGRASTGGFLGLGGVECHRLALQGRRANAELWVGVADQLPHKLVATFHHAGNAQLRVDFLAWNLAASGNAAAFAFNPPRGAEKIEMWTTARMNSARKH
jgi:hypothetical protein